MANVIHIKLLNIPAHLESGDAIECTVDGTLYKCEFVQYGMSDRFVYVRVFGIREISNGRLSTQLDMFEPSSFVTEFVVNDAPGKSWHRTAGMSAEVE